MIEIDEIEEMNNINDMEKKMNLLKHTGLSREEIQKQVDCEYEEKEYQFIAEELDALKELSTHFSDIIGEQGMITDEIDLNVETTLNNVNEGTEYLKESALLAEIYRSRTVRTVSGAIIGGVLLGGAGGLLAGGIGVLTCSVLGSGAGAILGIVG